MRRHLINLGAAGSVLLCVVLVVLWVRSYRNDWHGDHFPADGDVRPGVRWQVRSEGGGVTVCELEFWSFGGVATGGKVVPRYNSRRGLRPPLLVGRRGDRAAARGVVRAVEAAAATRHRRSLPGLWLRPPRVARALPECGAVPARTAA